MILIASNKEYGIGFDIIHVLSVTLLSMLHKSTDHITTITFSFEIKFKSKNAVVIFWKVIMIQNLVCRFMEHL